MKLKLLLTVLLLLSTTMCFGMAQRNLNSLSAEPSTSLIVGIHGDYVSLENGKTNWSGVIGMAFPISTGSGRWYGLMYGEMGKYTDELNQYQFNLRTIYYFSKPGTGLSIGALLGATGSWEEIQYLTQEQTVVYLLGATGLVLSKPIGGKIGLWGAFEFQLGAEYSTYRAGVGLNIHIF